jgi:calcium-dependent protein kinase
MGCCFSSAPVALIDNTDGDEVAYHARYIEDEILGEGEFGVVKLIHEKSTSSSQEPAVPYACKILRKGIVFKDNTLYSPLKPETLRGEIEMLRRLRGEAYCLQLLAVYETPRTIYMITQYYSGGELVEYVSQLSETELQIPDASRIAYQLLSAIHHCHVHRVLHRDVKPENVLFETSQPGSDLRLIDFGS